jgi:type I restriction enzyme R subunit
VSRSVLPCFLKIIPRSYNQIKPQAGRLCYILLKPQAGRLCYILLKPQFVTFRLADSLPVSKLNQWISERNHWMKEHPEPWSDDEWEEYSRLFPVRMEEWIDAGSGECLLGCPENSKIVVECLRHFDGERYALDQFVVMPNHVHAIVAPVGSHSLSKITQTWKSFTSHEINKRWKKVAP